MNTTPHGAQAAPTSTCASPEDPETPPAPPPPTGCERCRNIPVLDLDGNLLGYGLDFPA